MNSQTNPLEPSSKILSSKEAGEILGYTHDYVSRLCRQGHMVGVRKGREWYITPADLEVFKQKHELVLQEKKKQLSQKLSVIRKNHEAQKRKAKQQKTPQAVPVSQNEISQTIPVSTNSHAVSTPPQMSVQKQALSISIPKRLIATGVLASVLFLPTFINILDGVAQDASEINVTASVSQSAGIANSFVSSVKALPSDTLQTIETIGNGYLVIYELQGQIIHESLQQVSLYGTAIISGYELTGEYIWLGTKNIINTLGQALNFASNYSQKKFLSYISNVSGGYGYVFEQVSFAFNDGVIKNLSQGFSIVATNLSQNISAMSATVSSVSYSLHASIGSAFSGSGDTNRGSHIFIKNK